MEKLVLFDIDGTLTKGRGHRESMMHGIRSVFGIDVVWPPEGYPGWTDQQIILYILTKKGLDRETIMGRIHDCMEEMVRHYKSTIKDREVLVFDGVKELLDELRRRGFLLGLVTGNVEGIAWTKLGKAGLAGYFSLGGFGSDNVERAELVRIAAKRTERMGFKPGGDVVVIGDTHRDVEAGKAAGVRTVIVFSGHEPREMFESSGADLMIESLQDKERILEMIG